MWVSATEKVCHFREPVGTEGDRCPCEARNARACGERGAHPHTRRRCGGSPERPCRLPGQSLANVPMLHFGSGRKSGAMRLGCFWPRLPSLAWHLRISSQPSGAQAQGLPSLPDLSPSLPFFLCLLLPLLLLLPSPCLATPQSVWRKKESAYARPAPQVGPHGER